LIFAFVYAYYDLFILTKVTKYVIAQCQNAYLLKIPSLKTNANIKCNAASVYATWATAIEMNGRVNRLHWKAVDKLDKEYGQEHLASWKNQTLETW